MKAANSGRKRNPGSPLSTCPDDARCRTQPRLFGEECFWRDLVAFTWNVKTLEGRGRDRGHAARQSGRDRSVRVAHRGRSGSLPRRWRWRSLGSLRDRRRARGRGVLRLKDGKAWTLLTTLEELKGFEERKAERRPMGTTHGVYRRERNLARGETSRGSRAWRDEATLLSSSSAAARAALRSARASSSSTFRRSSSRRTRALAIPGATAIARSCCTTRSGTTIYPISRFRRTGRFSRRRTRSATGSRCTSR